MTPGPLLLAADVGGTSTRVLLADLDGRVLRVARGGAGNPNVVGPDAAAAQLRAVLTECLTRDPTDDPTDDLTEEPARSDPGRVVAAVVGLAGLSAVADVDAFARQALPGIDPAVVRVVGDFVTAFASGTPEPAGYILMAGTGAGAMRLEDGALIRRHDAWGWLLGDAGSGFWLGREAVRTTLTILETGRPPGPLAQEVLRRTASWDLSSLLSAVYARPPIWLAECAPAVTRTADTDPLAAEISHRAATALLDTLLELDPQPGRVIVTTGSVLAADSPVRRGVLQAIDRRLDNPVRPAADGLAGAFWLAGSAVDRTARGGIPGAIGDGSDLAVHARIAAAVRAATPA